MADGRTAPIRSTCLQSDQSRQRLLEYGGIPSRTPHNFGDEEHMHGLVQRARTTSVRVHILCASSSVTAGRRLGLVRMRVVRVRASRRGRQQSTSNESESSGRALGRLRAERRRNTRESRPAGERHGARRCGRR